jgi:hypothetical protein
VGGPCKANDRLRLADLMNTALSSGVLSLFIDGSSFFDYITVHVLNLLI